MAHNPYHDDRIPADLQQRRSLAQALNPTRSIAPRLPRQPAQAPQAPSNQTLATRIGGGINQAARAAGQGIVQGYNVAATPFRESREAYGQLFNAALGNPQQPPVAQQQTFANSTAPQLDHTPQNRTFETRGLAGRQPSPPSLAQAQPGLEQTPFGGGTRQITPDSRTIYNVPGGQIDFPGLPGGLAARQDLPQGGQFSGARTNAEAAATLADYRNRGLDINGNDQRSIAELTQRAEQQRSDRLARNDARAARREATTLDAQRQLQLDRITRAASSDVPDDIKAGALALQALSAIPQESAQGRLAQANQQNRQSLASLSQQQQQFDQQQAFNQQRALLDYDAKLIAAVQKGDNSAKLDPYDQAFSDAYKASQEANALLDPSEAQDPYAVATQARDDLLRQKGLIRSPDGQTRPIADVLKMVQAEINKGESPEDVIGRMVAAGYGGLSPELLQQFQLR